MSDENMKLNVDVEFRSAGSATIAALQAKIKALKDQLDKSFAPNRITKSIIPDSTMKDLAATGKSVNGLTKKYIDMAKEARTLGQMNARVWKGMQQDIKDHARAWEQASGKDKQRLEKSLREKVKYHQAYRFLYNKENDRFLAAQQSLSKAETDLKVAQWKRDERLTREGLSNRLRSHRAFMAAINQTRSFSDGLRRAGVRAGVFGAAVGYGTAHATGSVVSSATDFDRAMANARINMDEKDIPGGFNGLRERILPKAVELGQDPARYAGTIVDAAKAGVPEAMAEGTGSMVTMLAKTFGVEIEQAMDGMGYAIAQEFGAGRLTDMTGVRRLGNIAAGLAAKTAARPDQMFSFLRTGMGAGAMLGMNQESTLAFGASAIQAGAQGQQAARFLTNIGETLSTLTMEADAKIKERHKSKKDQEFLNLPSQLGYGSYADIEQRIKRNPNTAIFDLIKSFGKIKAPLDREKAMSMIFGEGFARFLANMIASPKMLDRTQELAHMFGQQTEANDFISEAWKEFSASLEFFLDRIKATWKVLKTELGDVLKPFVEDLSNYITDWYNAIQTSGIKAKFRGFMNGLVEGFLGRPGSFRELLDETFGTPGKSAVNADSYFKFARGFAAGIREFASSFGSAMKFVAKYFSGNDDAEALGRLTAKIVAFVGALAALSPVLSVFGTLVTIVGVIAAIVGGPAAIAGLAGIGIGGYLGKKLAEWVKEAEAKTSEKVNAPPEARTSSETKATPKDKQKEIDDWTLRQLQRAQPNNKSLFHRSSYTTEDLGKQINNLGAKIERASFMSTDISARRRTGGGGLSYAYEGAGSSAGATSGVPGLVSGVGTPDALWKNVTPGGALPNFGMGAGGIIRRGRIGGAGGGSAGSVGTSIPGGGPADMTTGQGLSGNAFLAARRARFAEEIKNDPTLRMHLAAMQMTEGASGGGTVEALMNRMDMTGQTLRQGLGAGQDGLPNTKFQFYGPIKQHQLPEAIRKLQRDPKLFAKFDRYTQQALAGSHKIGGFTDQGLPTDPNGTVTRARKGLPALPTVNYGGNEFTEWLGNKRARDYRQMIEKGIQGTPDSPIGGVPQPADAIKNVPAAPVPAGGSDSRMSPSGNQIAIHINGGSHDPETLANLVQKRIDEQMNWRTHDTASEYT
ncbi:phage tail tape measure protein [Bradyrhizobium sp. SZCCHNR3118]|uniref:phage tail tape measure protein n=1 Tax=Bradyrhizobium sp. SZCCHNR3118 TaxID=3057468 RepID=UPI002916174D|nr:phage tail tape measure protein [Bradyrhizobium sp. SZCCHNR3118]